MSNLQAQEVTPAAGNLTAKQQSLVSISALTAVGNLEQLKEQLNIGLDSGLTINEIKEALSQLYAYCGFPRSLNAIHTFMEVARERKAKGIEDKQGVAITMYSTTGDRYEKGRKVLETLTGEPQTKPAPGFGEFAPRVDAFLKEHLFSDIFDSKVLTYMQRELVTIAALASTPGAESQLQFHINVGKNTGLTEIQLKELADLIEQQVDRTRANAVRKIISVPAVSVSGTDMIVRISELEILPEFLEEYRAILKEEAAISVKIEPGVIAIFPMYQKDNQAQVRIVEIYADKAAYQSHLQTAHFKHYKTSTAKMVKTLKLVDMDNIDTEAMSAIFKKLK